MKLSELTASFERLLQSQALIDRIYAALMRKNLISDGYQWKMFCKPNYERSAMVISIYIAKQTKIEVNINFEAIEQVMSMPDGELKLEYCVLDRIIEELDIARCNKDLRNKIQTLCKEKNIKEETTMQKTQNEIEFENFANERRAQADAEFLTYKDEVEKEIEAKRKEYLEKDRKDRIYNVAADYRCFFDGLIAAGFNEDQAMSILLEKCTFFVN